MQAKLFFQIKVGLLYVVVFILLGVMRFIILVCPFRWVVKWFLQPRRLRARFKLQSDRAKILGWVIERVALKTPWVSKCLVQGLTCRFLLRLFAIPSIFYIGVANDETGKLISHAWMGVENTVIIGGQSSFETFKVITSYADL